MTPAQKACWDAAKRIERYGWIQGEFGNSRMGYCVLGAFPPKCYRSVKFLKRVGDIQFLTDWNDAPGRTPEEVIDLLVIASMWEDE